MLHTSIVTALAPLAFDHLGPAEQLAARRFAELAFDIVSDPRNTGVETGPNTTVILRKLAEAQALAVENARRAGQDAQTAVHGISQSLGRPI